jgi:hypothetical protein
MKWLCAFFLLSFPLVLPAQTASLSAEEWARPRHGEALARHPGLAQTVKAVERREGELRIRHGEREADLLWAAELRDWLVALGLPSARIRLVRDPAVRGQVVLDVRARGGE